MRATCRKPPSRAVRDEQLFDRPETRPLALADLRGRHRQLESWSTREQRLQGAHAFDAGKLMAKAEMDPGAEGEMPVRPALKVEPYEHRVVLPHERTHAGPKEGRKRLLEALGAHPEPIFLLYDGAPPYEHPAGEPELETEGTRLWQIPPDGIAEAFADKQLLIADGHHRYETAVASGVEDILVVLVSTDDPGLMIFPTHRIAERVNGTSANKGLEDALAELEAQPAERAAAVVYRKGGAALVEGDEGALDVQLVESLAPGPVRYTPSVDEAVAAVEEGDAEGAFIVRPTRIEDVFRFAQAGETLPQKTTYFYPKLLSGLLFLPLES